MKRYVTLFAFCLVFSFAAVAQQDPNDTPATKEDIQKYLDVTHSRQMMAQMVDAMLKPMHQMIHEQFEKDKDKLPADFESRMTKMMDDSIKSFPWDEMIDSMIPVYQKHLTRGDVNAMVAFYSTPTGQKLLREMPQIMAEAMQNMMPMMRRQMEAMQQRMQEEVTAMIKDYDSSSKSNQKPNRN
jgi:hypothetical protein